MHRTILLFLYTETSYLKAIQGITQQIAQLPSHYLKIGKFSQSPLYKALKKIFQDYANIFIVYICPDENSVYFYLSCVPSSAILRGMITCYVSAYCKTQMHILPPECLQKTFSKGLLSNFPVSKRFFFPAYFSRRITRHLQSFSSIAYP